MIRFVFLSDFLFFFSLSLFPFLLPSPPLFFLACCWYWRHSMKTFPRVEEVVTNVGEMVVVVGRGRREEGEVF